MTICGAIYALSLDAFKDNFLYTPIDEAEFMEQNRRLLPVVRPELVLLAERHDRGGGSGPDAELVAFLFAVPDVLQQKRGQTPDTIIIKTVAVRPGLGHAGLGKSARRGRAAARRRARLHARGARLDARAERVAKHQPALRRDDQALRPLREAARALRDRSPHEHRRNPAASRGRSRRRRGHRRSPRSAQLPRAGRGVGARGGAARTARARAQAIRR